MIGYEKYPPKEPIQDEPSPWTPSPSLPISTTQNWFLGVAQYRHKMILSAKNRYAQAGTQSRKNVSDLDGVVKASSHFSVLRKSIIQYVQSLFVEIVLFFALWVKTCLSTQHWSRFAKLFKSEITVGSSCSIDGVYHILPGWTNRYEGRTHIPIFWKKCFCDWNMTVEHLKNMYFQKIQKNTNFFDTFGENTLPVHNSNCWKSGILAIFDPEPPFPPRKPILSMYASAVGDETDPEMGTLICRECSGGRFYFANSSDG